MLVAGAGERASMCFREEVAANIGNPHTRRAYAPAAEKLLIWCANAGVPPIGAVPPVHVDRGEASMRELAAPSVKLWLAALRRLFDWLVNGQSVPLNPDTPI